LVYCIHCGQQNPDDAVSCSNCGKHLYPPSERGRARHRARPTRRSSDACWEEGKKKETTRGEILGIGFVFIIIALFISWAIFYTPSFEAFWEGFGRTMERIFTNLPLVQLIGPAIFIAGVIIVLYGLTRSRD